MDSTLIPSLILIVLTVWGLAVWRTSGPWMARLAAMGAGGSLGIWLLQRDWTLTGAALLGLGIVLMVVNALTVTNGVPSWKHPVMLLAGGTLVMLAVVAVTMPYIDDARVKTTLVVLMVTIGAAFLIAMLVSTFRLVAKHRTQ
jgi:hypothetical protein